MQTQLARTEEELSGQIAMLQRDRDDALIQAENDKQQVRGPRSHWILN